MCPDFPRPKAVARAVAELPPASLSERGEIVLLQGGPGQPDRAYICLKKSSNECEWVLIASAS